MDYNKWDQIDHMIFDVDGVFTDSSLMITESGKFLRKMNVRDGMALKKALDAGYTLAIITKGNSAGVRDRFTALGIPEKYIYDNVKDKEVALKDLLKHSDIDLSRTLYMGDDLSDLIVLQKVLLATCPHDAAHEVWESCEFISPFNGGQGCVRDLIERVMRVQGKW